MLESYWHWLALASFGLNRVSSFIGVHMYGGNRNICYKENHCTVYIQVWTALKIRIQEMSQVVCKL